MEEPPDRTIRLLDDWYQGNPGALGELLEDHQEWIQGRARRELVGRDRNALDSNDLVQEGLARLLRQGPRYAPRNRAEFRALLGKVLRSTLIDQRQRRDAVKRGGDATARLPSQGLSRVIVDGAAITLPGQAAELRERDGQVAEAIAQLPELDQLVLRMRHFENRSFQEVCEAADLDSPDAARMRYHRALTKLALWLADLDPNT